MRERSTAASAAQRPAGPTCSALGDWAPTTSLGARAPDSLARLSNPSGRESTASRVAAWKLEQRRTRKNFTAREAVGGGSKTLPLLAFDRIVRSSPRPGGTICQYRLDPGLSGLDIHWSRIVDLPIATLILILKPLFSRAVAERWACASLRCCRLPPPLSALASRVEALPHRLIVAAIHTGADRVTLTAVIAALGLGRCPGRL